MLSTADPVVVGGGSSGGGGGSGGDEGLSCSMDPSSFSSGGNCSKTTSSSSGVSFEEGGILVRIKSANHPSAQDLEFNANQSFSVLQLKETIHLLSTHHPEVNEQRLIYSGHLLEDNQSLKEVLTVKTGAPQLPNDPHQPVTFHLATTSKYIFATPKSSGGGEIDNKGGGGGGVGGVSAGGGEFGAGGGGSIHDQQQYDNEQHHRNHYRMFYPLRDSGMGYNYAPFSNTSAMDSVTAAGVEGRSPALMGVLHAAYVEQMTAYMNQWYMLQQGGWNYQMPTPQMQQSPVMIGPNQYDHTYYYNAQQAPQQFVPHQPQPQPPVEAPPPAPARPQENPHVVAARVAADEDENQRDLLDWMYTFSRVVLIFSVVYFYSSFSRFVLVVLFTALVMILQRRGNGQGRGIVEPGAQPQPPPQPPQAAAAAAEEGQQNEEGAGGGNGNADVGGGGGAEATPPVVEVVVAPPQRNLGEIAWTFLTTFFTSLIPENYQNN